MNKKDKREFNQQKFKEMIRGNYHLGKFYKKKDFYFSGQKLSCETIIGWKLKNQSSDIDEDNE
jgi:hypothetical protein